MHNVFISYHHANDQSYKNHLVEMNRHHKIFVDYSVQTRDISDDLAPQTIRRIIRDERLRDSTVTILLLGIETRFRKHVDWELKSSMIDGAISGRSGILVIALPYIGCPYWHTSNEAERKIIYPDYSGWFGADTRRKFEEMFPHAPKGIIDNLINPEAKISVVPWGRISNSPNNLRLLIDNAAEARFSNKYDLSEPMRMRDGSSRMSLVDYI